MERRRATRRTPVRDEPLSRMRLRAGRELAVVNVSSSGALIEGATRLLPGTHVEVHIVTAAGRTLVCCRVVRAYVCRVEAALIRYRGAIMFERPIDTTGIGYAVRDALMSAATESGNAPLGDQHFFTGPGQRNSCPDADNGAARREQPQLLV